MENQNTPTPGALDRVPTSDLIIELQRRMNCPAAVHSGDVEPCLILALTPSDLSEYWESDESGATHPGSATPTPEEWPAIVRAFSRWQDCGGFTEIMEVCRDAWNDAKEKGGSK